MGVEIQFTTWGAIVTALGVGIILGCFNGLMITRLKIPPFVATLGMLSIARGLTMLWTKGFPITGLGDGFAMLGTRDAFGVPMPVWIAVVLIAVFALMSKKTRLGRYIYAIGGNEQTARLSGLHVNRVKVMVYTFSGALSAVAGLITTSRLDSAQPNAGTGYELDSIAAVVIGGTSLSGGRGSIVGTVIGCLIIGVLNSGLVLLDVSPFWQQVIKGAVILVAVAIDRLRESESN
jgi:ribose transport system permease protein